MQQYVQLKAKEVSNKPITLAPEKSLYDVRNAMLRYNISRIVIAKNGKAVGIITEKDVARILYRFAADRRISEIRADEVMSKSLITVNEHSGINISAKLMDDRRVSSVIVVDIHEKLKGIITKSDLVNVYARYYLGRNLVKDHMTKQVFTVAPDETTHTVLSVMEGNNISRVVVTRNKKPIGIITGRDLLPMSALFGPDTYETIKEAFASHKQANYIIPSGISAVFLARDVMKYHPITTTENSDLADAAKVLTQNRISGLPVVDPNDELVGIITKSDIIRAIATGT